MKTKLFFMAVLPLLVTACSGSTEPADPESAIEAGPGEEFDVLLESNPSTGYHWEFLVELDESILKFVGKDYRAAEPVRPGSGGMDVWTFKAVGTGETEIRLGYYPPAPNSKPAETRTFKVSVE
jgi:predicted secreted protein